ncbi:DUF4260 domain-containing protein [Gymnodinialimonas hymeniacidonis]|uniref:DUF4260 domain-containing protein n=1 Tax=Gymnodinialimonas hymeniacidonis TaxID=3126508 RepID=UPI0034C61398
MHALSSTPTDPVIFLLRLEGLAVGLAAIGIFKISGASWLLFALLILVPDLAMVGYLWGSRIGAICYNFTHTYITPIVLAGAGWSFGAPLLVHIAVIWVIHIGLDRAIGYGLKRKSGFMSTHLASKEVA